MGMQPQPDIDPTAQFHWQLPYLMQCNVAELMTAAVWTTPLASTGVYHTTWNLLLQSVKDNIG